MEKKNVICGILIIIILIAIISGLWNLSKSDDLITGQTIKIHTEDLTPAMTSENDPIPYRVITETQTGEPNRAFDHTDKAWYHDDSEGRWITFDFGSGNEKQIEKYVITSAHYKGAPKIWVLYAYNSPTVKSGEYKILDKRGNITGWESNENRTFYINNDEKYRFYRFQVSATVDDAANLQIQEIEYMEKLPLTASAKDTDAEDEDELEVSEEDELPAPEEEKKSFFEWLKSLFSSKS